jgi:nucleoside-diphosphate-sugar epimerase
VLFHCAAELKDESIMWDVNVKGTRRLVNIVRGSGIKYFCFLSSAGVVGNVKGSFVDESTECNPYNVYEKSKWQMECIVAKELRGCHVAIIRPTNVFDEERLGVMSFVRGGWFNRIKLFIKGGEYAHVVHADDVAAAAIYLMRHPTDTPQCYFMSCDHDRLSTYAGISMLYRSFRFKIALENIRKHPHLPVGIAHVLRRLIRGQRNRGDVRYSSEKLISSGFKYEWDLCGAVRRIAERHI